MQSGLVIVGKYRLNQLLGTGGMAEVWSATNVFTEREFAVKFLSPEVAKTPEHAARFLKEAKVSARVNHPNIIDILDVGQTDDGKLFLVMELLSGVPLEVAMRRQTPPMTIPELVFVMTEVASALAAAHRAGVVHRDLKPSNIYLHRDHKSHAAVPKLLDFGVSKFLEDGGPNVALTMAGTVLGSPLYMSPEQARGDSNLDGRTDVFAFGAILFEALTGQRPFDAANFNALIVKIATTPPKDIDVIAPEVPDALRDVVKRCLEPQRDHRLATFEAVAERLVAILPELEKDPRPLPPPQTILSTDDPDATNALPIVRPGDRPLSVPPPPAAGTPHFSAWPTPTPHLSYTTSPASFAPPASAPAAHMRSIYAGGAAAAAAIVVLLVLLVTALRREPTVITVAGPAQITSASAPAPSVSSDPAVPTVAVDTLPVASKSTIPLEKGKGRLFISAGPSWCTVTVDGVSKGPTPLPALDLAPGTHQLRCDAPSKKSKTVSVVIQEAATANYKFSID
jgi:serine/threonine protein kinase